MKTSKELEEIAKKDPMELTVEDIIKIEKANPYLHTESQGSNPIDFKSEAEGLLMIKKEAPELYLHDVKMDIALALGKYTPGKGAFKKKYAKPYFPEVN
jgi:hypothetical protein